MLRRFCAVLVLSCIVPLTGAVAQSLSERALAQSIERILERDLLPHSLWGINVIDVNTGETIYERNAEKSFVPASNTKLFTTSAALETLGPDYRYTTTVWTDGEIIGNTLVGNLIVRGSGDPAIGGRFHDGEVMHVFESWVDSLRALGITQIDGDIIGDDDVFDDVPLGAGWAWDNEQYWYSAEIGGLTFNDNNIDVEIRAGRMGSPASISWTPLNTGYVTIRNHTTTVHTDSSMSARYARERASNVITIANRIPEGRTTSVSLTITNPTLYFVHVLQETLHAHGIGVLGSPVDVDDISIKPDYEAPGMTRVASYTSVPMTEIVDVINKRSQNLYAEQVLRTIGAESDKDDESRYGSLAAKSIERARETWAAAGVDTSHFRIADGSGLSRLNLISPMMTTQLLTYMWSHPDDEIRDAFVASLPIGGVDGTLSTRFRAGRALGNVRAKTGSLSGVSALSGYVRTRAGRDIAFSILVNNYTVNTSTVRDVQDEIVELIAAW